MLPFTRMRPRRSQQRIQALTLIQVVVILGVLTILVALCVPALNAAKRKAQRTNCVLNLRQIDVAYRDWGEDHFDQYPLGTIGTNNGTTGLLRAGIPDSQLAFWNFAIMSNMLPTPKVLHCPADNHTTLATSFTNGFSNSNISYFVSVNAAEDYPQMILSGDDNLAINGTPVKSGVLEISSNDLVTWTDERHRKCGNIGLADGSAQQVTSQGMQMALQNACAATTNSPNRFAIP